MFKPNKYQCPNCKDIIWSKYPGEYVTCSCSKLAVDQTEFYTRLIGTFVEPYKEDKDEKEAVSK